MSDTPSSPGPWGDPHEWSSPSSGSAPQNELRPQPPQPVRTAVTLMYVGAALGVLSILVTFTQRDAIREQIMESDETLTGSELDAAVNAGMIVTVLFGLIGVGLWIWMAIMNGRGKSWARIVATVLGGLNILMSGLGLVAGAAMGQADTAFNTLMTVIGLILAAVILILLWQRESSEYYEATTRWDSMASWG